MTPEETYADYRTMDWTSDHDECESGCGRIMDSQHYVAGDLGHYCSHRCLHECESEGPFDDRAAERKQMGL